MHFRCGADSSLGNRVRAQYVNFIAPRDHGNTDGVDPDSCNDVHVSDVLIDVGDDVRTSSARFQYECGMLDSVEPGDGVQSRWWWCSAESTPLTPLPEVGGWGEGRGALCFPFYANCDSVIHTSIHATKGCQRQVWSPLEDEGKGPCTELPL